MKQTIYDWCVNCVHGGMVDKPTLMMCRGCLRTIIYENMDNVVEPDHFTRVGDT